MEILIITFSVVMWTAIGVEGEIRCYCNDATCVSTGYMCKSALGKCYSMTYQGDRELNQAWNHAKSVHGCAEFLPKKDLCSGEGDVYTQASHKEWPAVMCCTDDMCNYLASIDINIYINTQSNDTRDPSVHRSGSSSQDGASRQIHYNYRHQRELWFKAAVIAVPIAGGFILILLVLLAVRMLRNDHREHRHLLQLRQNTSLTKAQLYVANHFCDKDHDHAQNNGTDCKSTHVYKDINIKVDRDGHGYEKISSSDTSNQSSSCNSVVVWGQEDVNKVDPAIMV